MGMKLVDSGRWKQTEAWLQKLNSGQYTEVLKGHAQNGVDALVKATPVDTGVTAEHWYYVITVSSTGLRIDWHNDAVENGFHVAMGLQHGHASRSGSWVSGVDYINPAIQPVFEAIMDDILKEVMSL